MSQVPNTRINAVEQIETMLKGLTSYGYDTRALWAEHNAWLDSLDTVEVTDEDRTWARQLPVASSTEAHFVTVLDSEGNVIGNRPEDLTSTRAHVGRQYSLTPGQREVLRDRYGMTPAKVVELANVQLFPKEDVIYSITLRTPSTWTAKGDPKLKGRMKVLNEVVIQPASAFFRDAAMKDKEREDAKAAREDEDKPRKVKQVTSLAMGYLT